MINGIKVESFQSLTCEKHNSKLRKGSRDLDAGFVVIRQFCRTSIHCSVSASSTGHLNWMGLNWRKKNIMGIMCSVVRNFKTAAGRKQRFHWRRTSLINKAVLDQGQEHCEGLCCGHGNVLSPWRSTQREWGSSFLMQSTGTLKQAFLDFSAPNCIPQPDFCLGYITYITLTAHIYTIQYSYYSTTKIYIFFIFYVVFPFA